MSSYRITKKKRKLFRFAFSLRAMLIVLTVATIWFGSIMHRAREQRKAVEWAKSIGGEIYYDFHFSSNGKFGPKLRPTTPDWLIKLLGIDFFNSVERLYINCRQREFTYTMRSAGSTSEYSDLFPLGPLSYYKGSVKEPANMVINDISLLSNLKNLNGLVIYGTEVRDFSSIEALTSLEYLQIIDSQFANLALLSNHPNLERITLVGTKISDLRPLTTIPNLELLNIGRTRVKDIGPLYDCAGLKQLDLREAMFPYAEINELIDRLPECTIRFGG